jgi:hypothetical protein
MLDQDSNMNANAIFRSVVLSTMIACGSHDAQAADIDGVWASDASVCLKIFQRNGDKISFAKDSELYGHGFVIDGKQIRGKTATCTVKLLKEQDRLVNLIAVCSTDIAIDTMQFRLRMDRPNRIIREFPGLPEIEMSYERCSL